jgi:hypothetical protein
MKSIFVSLPLIAVRKQRLWICYRTLWFRNTWVWDKDDTVNPALEQEFQTGALRFIKASHTKLGEYRLYGRQTAELLFTDNESNNQRLWGQPNLAPCVKDAFHRRLINNELNAVNPAQSGTKSAAWHKLTIPARGVEKIELVLLAGAGAGWPCSL